MTQPLSLKLQAIYKANLKFPTDVKPGFNTEKLLESMRTDLCQPPRRRQGSLCA